MQTRNEDVRKAAGGRGSRRMVVGPAVAVALAALLASGGGAGAQDAGASADPEALAILEEAAARYAAMDGFCADFHQVRRIPLLGREAESEGRLCQMDPGYFLMDFTDPDGDRVVADGEYLWVYYPSSDPGQVLRFRPGRGQNQFDFHSEFLSSPGERYEPRLEGREEVDGRAVHLLELHPLQDTHFVGARLWIDAETGDIRRAELEEEDERLRIVELSDIRVNPDMGPGDFHFDVPEGAQVIDR